MEKLRSVLQMEKLRNVLGITSDTSREELKNIFKIFDVKGEKNDAVTFDEFKKGLETSKLFKDNPENNFSEEELSALFKEIAGMFSENGFELDIVRVSELMEALRPSLNDKRKDFLKKYFEILSGGDGSIDIKDMRRLTLDDETDDSWDDGLKYILERNERAGKVDGKLTYTEFEANHSHQSQLTYGDDEAFGKRILSIWEAKMDYSWN